MDNIQKQKGVPYSTSRKEEKKNKHRTIKARRQEDKMQQRYILTDTGRETLLAITKHGNNKPCHVGSEVSEGELTSLQLRYPEAINYIRI